MTELTLLVSKSIEHFMKILTWHDSMSCMSISILICAGYSLITWKTAKLLVQLKWDFYFLPFIKWCYPCHDISCTGRVYLLCINNVKEYTLITHWQIFVFVLRTIGTQLILSNFFILHLHLKWMCLDLKMFRYLCWKQEYKNTEEDTVFLFWDACNI